MTAPRSYDSLLCAVEADIFEGRCRPGDRLPSERQLREQYGVSRSTVREALRILEQRGLVEIRQGAAGGAFVKALEAGRVSAALVQFMRHSNVTYDQLIELREAVEARCAAHAAERATAAEVADLEALLSEGRTFLDTGRGRSEAFYRWDLRMHQRLARLSGNPLFEWLMGTVPLYNWDHLSQLLFAQPGAPRQVVDDWTDIVAALRERQVLRVQSLLSMHLSRFSAILRRAVAPR